MGTRPPSPAIVDYFNFGAPPFIHGLYQEKDDLLGSHYIHNQFPPIFRKKSSKSPKNYPHHLPKWIFPLPHASQQKNNKQKKQTLFTC